MDPAGDHPSGRLILQRSAEDLIAHLKLKPLPLEGGYFTETYRSAHGTAIYYLLTPDTVSRLHRLPGDELFHFYLGDPVEQLVLHADGRSERRVLGPDLETGQHLQALVPGGAWQGARLLSGGAFALLGTTMAPPFEFDHFEPGNPEALAAAYPEAADFIYSLR